MSDNELMEFKAACIFDLCMTEGNIAVSFCMAAEALVQRCREDFNIQPPKWRSPSMCRTFYTSLHYLQNDVLDS